VTLGRFGEDLDAAIALIDRARSIRASLPAGIGAAGSMKRERSASDYILVSSEGVSVRGVPNFVLQPLFAFGSEYGSISVHEPDDG
jgi:hypothetical protein